MDSLYRQHLHHQPDLHRQPSVWRWEVDGVEPLQGAWLRRDIAGIAREPGFATGHRHAAELQPDRLYADWRESPFGRGPLYIQRTAQRQQAAHEALAQVRLFA